MLIMRDEIRDAPPLIHINAIIVLLMEVELTYSHEIMPEY